MLFVNPIEQCPLSPQVAMSGLRHRGLHGFVTVWPHEAGPGMRRCWVGGTPWCGGWRAGHHPDRPRSDGVIAKRRAAVGDPHRSVLRLFPQHRLGVDRRLDLNQLAVVGHGGPVAPHDPGRLQPPHPVELTGRGVRPMPISRLRRRDGHAPVVRADARSPRTDGRPRSLRGPPGAALLPGDPAAS